MKHWIKWGGLLLLLGALLSVSACGSVEGAGTANGAGGQQPAGEASNPDNEADVQPDQETADEKTEIAQLVDSFGKKLQLVSLLAPEHTVRERMQELYADFLSPTLLNRWQNNPEQALGRTVSSPWPERIDILTVEKVSDDEYRVEGEVVEVVAGVEEELQEAARMPVTFEVRNIDGRWLINGVEQADDVVYVNSEYGFRFSLPGSWAGFAVVNETWEGVALVESQAGEMVESGPQLVLRHPQWTADQPRQDIPIMIFTLDQWEALLDEQFAVGAAPVAPTELGRNESYVFALPARYHFSFHEGYEEVEEILANDALQPLPLAE